MIEQQAAIRLANIRLASGLRLHYAECGDPADHPLVLLHGLSDSWFSYSRVLAALGANYHVYALDQRGHGDSDRPEAGYSTAEMAADAIAFMDAQGLPKATLIGHSMGSAVAIEAALAAPERLAGLILVGANTSWNNPGIVEFLGVLDAMQDPMDPAFIREFQASTAYEPLPEAFMARVVAESLKLPARAWRGAVAGIVAANYLDRLGEIRVPTLVLGGEEDSYCPAEHQRELAARLGNAQLKLYPKLAHCPHWERPAEFVRDVEGFLMRTLPRRFRGHA